MAEPYGSFTSRLIPLPAENVDTDQIVPARYLKVTDKEGLADALFHDWRYDADGGQHEPLFVMDRLAMAGRRILLAGDNFGTGSSREHAPWALTQWGFRAVIVDFDLSCKAPEAWRKKKAGGASLEQPWYHLFVDGSDQVAYAPEDSLQLEEPASAVRHTLLQHFFDRHENGKYWRNSKPWPGTQE